MASEYELLTARTELFASAICHALDASFVPLLSKSAEQFSLEMVAFETLNRVVPK